MKLWKLVLAGVTVAILGLFALGLGNDPRFIPSPLVGRAAPEFAGGEALDGGPPIRMADFKGRQWVLVNFWGSWCISCRSEHATLMQIARQVETRDDMVMVGVDFKDSREAARRFLGQLGDPGYRHVFDPDQRTAIDWGVYGAPETFVVDPRGVVVFKQAGPVYPGWFESKVLPLVAGRAAR